MEIYRTSVGLDVHARSVVGCGLDRSTGEVFERRLTPDHREILEWIASLPSPAMVTYEAGPTGFGLARALAIRPGDGRIGRRIDGGRCGRGVRRDARRVGLRFRQLRSESLHLFLVFIALR